MATTSNKRKKAVAATVAAAAILLAGTFAWTSISQQAKNEAIVDINPGGRLHDDFNGTNKDVYVENFNADVDAVPIFARVKLTEYVELGPEAGNKDKTDVARNAKSWPSGNLALNAKPDTWQTYKPGTDGKLTNADNVSDEYWTLQWGNDENNQPYYLPTFNKNKDSLEADINGTYEGTVESDIVHYDDYVVYDESSEAVIGTEVEDWDENTLDEGKAAVVVPDPEKYPFGTDGYNIKETANVSHNIAQVTTTATVMTMQEWLDGNYGLGPYWVYDTDGWAYWAQPIQPGETTGLFLDGIQMHKVPDENWYYGLNVIGQFATESDIKVFSDLDTENGGGGGTTENADYLLGLLTGEEDEGGGDEPPAEEVHIDELVLDHDANSDAVSGGEWLVFNASVYDENGEWIAGTYDVDYKLTDQDGNELTQNGAAAASTGTSGFTSTYMKDNNLFVADNIQETDIESLTVTASYSNDGKSYENSITLSVGANENPLSIALNYNGTPVSHLANTENVYQIQTTDVANDAFKFSAALKGTTLTENLHWTIREMAEYPRGYTLAESTDGTSWNVVANNMWTEEYTSWKTVEEGTLLAQINKTTGEFKVLLDPDLYPGSMTFYVTAQTEDGENTKTDILFISYQPVIFYLENDDATEIMERHSASFTKGEETVVNVKPVRLFAGSEQAVGEDILNSLTLYYGQYSPGSNDDSNPVPQEYYTVTPNVDAGTAKLVMNIPDTVKEDYIYARVTYDHKTPTVNAEDGIYYARLTMQSTSVVKEGISYVNINDYSASEGQYTPGAYTKISLGAEAYTASNTRVWDATYGWSANVNGVPSDLVKIKFEKGQPSAELWILGLTEGEIKVTVVCSEAGKSETAATKTYTLSPAEAVE